MTKSDWDIVIAGGGAGGLAAAVRAAETLPDARIIVLERGGPNEQAGNTRWSGAFMRMADIDEVAAGFVRDLTKTASDFTSAAIATTLAESAPGAMQWLADKGVRFEQLPMYFLTATRPRLTVMGGGSAIIEALYRDAVAHGVDIRHGVTATSLALRADGSLLDVVCLNSVGEPATFAGKSVIIATGGFEGNPEMLAQNIGEHVRDLPLVAPGGRANRGEGIQMAIEVGAARAGQWDSYHTEPVDPRSRLPESVIMTYPYGILVNSDGLRFVDEGRGAVDENYEAVARLIAEQAGQIAYLIADSRIETLPGFERATVTDRQPYRANSVLELGRMLDIEQSTLDLTVANYNVAASGDDSLFDPTRADGLCTADGFLPVAKSNWARRIEVPPFVAYPVVPAIVFTFGGIATNERAEVLRQDGSVLPGLYAVGETAGLYAGQYPGGTSVMRAITFGRIAAEGAAGRVE